MPIGVSVAGATSTSDDVVDATEIAPPGLSELHPGGPVKDLFQVPMMEAGAGRDQFSVSLPLKYGTRKVSYSATSGGTHIVENTLHVGIQYQRLGNHLWNCDRKNMEKR